MVAKCQANHKAMDFQSVCFLNFNQSPQIHNSRIDFPANGPTTKKTIYMETHPPMWDEMRDCRSQSTSEAAETRNVTLAALSHYRFHVNI